MNYSISDPNTPLKNLFGQNPHFTEKKQEVVTKLVLGSTPN